MITLATMNPAFMNCKCNFSNLVDLHKPENSKDSKPETNDSNSLNRCSVTETNPFPTDWIRVMIFEMLIVVMFMCLI